MEITNPKIYSALWLYQLSSSKFIFKNYSSILQSTLHTYNNANRGVQSSSIFPEIHERPQENNSVVFHFSFQSFSVSLVFSQSQKILTELSIGIHGILLFLSWVKITEVLFSLLHRIHWWMQWYILKRVGKRHFSRILVRLKVFKIGGNKKYPLQELRWYTEFSFCRL